MKNGKRRFPYKIEKGSPLTLGAAVSAGGTNFAISVPEDKECNLILYPKGNETPIFTIPFPKEYKVGNIYAVFIEKFPANEYEYNFFIDKRLVQDPYAKEIIGKEEWGKLVKSKDLRCGFSIHNFDWKGDKPLCLPFQDTIIYTMHPRGFTKHSSSKVKNKGTFRGILEKIPYLKELGINQIELMPVYEFEEVILEAEEKLNYWGYTSGFYFTPKKSYISKGHGNEEFKELVRTLHENEIEIILEFYFSPGTSYGLILDCLRYWVLEYHIDGFHINSDVVPAHLIATDPLFSKTKIMCAGLNMDEIYPEKEQPSFIHIADYDEGFLTDIRQFLKGDENQLGQMSYRVLRNSSRQVVINYMANHNGFTFMDMVSYNNKYNEDNGNNNTDGRDYNFSWNHGVEGNTRKKKVLDLRRKQIKNALLLVILSQGVPLIYNGDEMGKTQKGNNNPYCQDNDISWINWNDKVKHQEIFEFTKNLIQFRKEHPILHKDKELRGVDYMACGYPEVSFHSKNAWYGDFSFSSRSIGIMYCGKYAKKNQNLDDDFLYFAYNINWEEETFALPTLPKNMKWKIAIDTDDKDGVFFYKAGEEITLKEQKYIIVSPRSIVVLIGK